MLSQKCKVWILSKVLRPEILIFYYVKTPKFGDLGIGT